MKFYGKAVEGKFPSATAGVAGEAMEVSTKEGKFVLNLQAGIVYRVKTRKHLSSRRKRQTLM